MQKRRADGGCDLVVLAWARAMLGAPAETLLNRTGVQQAEQGRTTRAEGVGACARQTCKRAFRVFTAAPSTADGGGPKAFLRALDLLRLFAIARAREQNGFAERHRQVSERQTELSGATSTTNVIVSK